MGVREMNAELFRTLRDQGLLLREIVEKTGYSRSTVSEYLSDPDGSKARARKDSYRGVCGICGVATTGCNGRAMAPGLCHHCEPGSAESRARRTRWTRRRIIEAFQNWNEVYGEPPAIPDWSPTHARRNNDEERAQRAERDMSGDLHPHAITVVNHFGSWNAGLAAAGFTPRPPHGGGENVARRRSMRSS